MIELVMASHGIFGNEGRGGTGVFAHFDLLYLNSASVVFRFPEMDKRVHIHAGQFLLLYPQTPFDIRTDTREATATVFHFKLRSPSLIKGTFLEEWSGQRNDYVWYHEPNPGILSSIKKARSLVFERRDELNRYLITSLVQLMLGELQLFQSRLASGREKIHGLLDSIHDSPQENWDIAMMSDRADMTESTLKRKFKLHTGLSPAKFVNQTRMLLAAKVLLETEESIRDIAERVGYPYLPHFYRNFKNYHKQTPQDYRMSSRALLEA